MILGDLSSSGMPSTHGSYWTEVQKRLCDKKITQSAKAAFWSLWGAAAALIPVPFVNGLSAGTMLFMGIHEIAQHPDSVYLHGLGAPIVESRTWKHITAGAAISGIGWGLGTLDFASHIPHIVRIVGALGGTALGFQVAYSDIVFAGARRQ